MDTFPVYVPKTLPKQENFISGRRSCKGCGKALACRIAAKALDAAPSPKDARDPLIGVGCTHHDVTTDSLISTVLDRADACAKAVPRHAHKPVIAVDRHVFETDFLAFTRTIENAGEAVFLCLDKELHVDRFIRSTGPRPFECNEHIHRDMQTELHDLMADKNMPPFALKHAFAYRATATPGYPLDLLHKIKKASRCAGRSFILVLTPCPTGWMLPADQSIRAAWLAVRSGYFPLFEVTGREVVLNEPTRKLRPLQEYIGMQKRFFTFPPALLQILQDEAETFYEKLSKAETINEIFSSAID